MGDSLTTRPSLLLRLRDPGNTQAWKQFIEIYTPLVYRYAVRRGLQDADAADVAQEVFKAVAANMERFEYDTSRGTFRSWLYTVARSKLNNYLARRQKQESGSGETRVHQLLENQSSPEPDDQTRWDIDYRRQLFEWGAREVRGGFQETTWNAFWQNAVESRPAKHVAETLGISVGAVYIAKSRVLSQIRQRIEQVVGKPEMSFIENDDKG